MSRDDVWVEIERRIREQPRPSPEDEARILAALRGQEAAVSRRRGWLAGLRALVWRRRAFCSWCTAPRTARHGYGTCSAACKAAIVDANEPGY